MQVLCHAHPHKLIHQIKKIEKQKLCDESGHSILKILDAKETSYKHSGLGESYAVAKNFLITILFFF